MSETMDELEQEFAEALDGMGSDGPLPKPAPAAADAESDGAPLRNPETGQFETAEQREERLYGGKYRTVEDLEAGYQNAEQRLGELGNEVGQWRQWAEQQRAQAAQAQQAQVLDQEKLDQWDEYASENPLAAAQMALQQQNGVLYERTMDTWYAEDPKSAARFEAALTARHQQAQFAQYVQPLMVQQQQQAQLSAYMAVRQRHPDIDQFGERIVQAAGVNPFLLPVVQHGTQQEKEQALETLYYMARGMDPGGQPPPVTANGQAPPPAVANGQRPYVASPSAIPAGAGPARAPHEALIDELWERGLQNG